MSVSEQIARDIGRIREIIEKAWRAVVIVVTLILLCVGLQVFLFFYNLLTGRLY